MGSIVHVMSVLCLINYRKHRMKDCRKFQDYTKNSQIGETIRLRGRRPLITFGKSGKWKKRKDISAKEANWRLMLLGLLRPIQSMSFLVSTSNKILITIYSGMAVREWAEIARKWFSYEIGADSSQARAMERVAANPELHMSWGTRGNLHVGGLDRR